VSDSRERFFTGSSNNNPLEDPVDRAELLDLGTSVNKASESCVNMHVGRVLANRGHERSKEPRPLPPLAISPTATLPPSLSLSLSKRVRVFSEFLLPGVRLIAALSRPQIHANMCLRGRVSSVLSKRFLRARVSLAFVMGARTARKLLAC
jgi:hypothetical protein